MAYNEKLADRVREMFVSRHLNVEEKKMFGGLCFMVNDKMCIGVEQARLMLRLDPAKYDEAMEKEGTAFMDFTGRVMKVFVFVDIEVLNTKNKLRYWIDLALAYNSIAPASKKRKIADHMFTGKIVLRGMGWFFFGLLAVGVGLYPMIYFFVERRFGLLGSKPAGLLSSLYWNAGFYVHIIFGGIALLIGWVQFSTRLRLKFVSLHRTIGKIYVVAAIASAMAGIGIGIFATAGVIAAVGFICLGIIWFFTTLFAFVRIRQGQIVAHQRLMIYSYAACFAAVTLRIWLPLLTSWLGDFNTAYRIVAWLCWIPNMFVAYFVCRRLPLSEV